MKSLTLSLVALFGLMSFAQAAADTKPVQPAAQEEAQELPAEEAAKAE